MAGVDEEFARRDHERARQLRGAAARLRRMADDMTSEAAALDREAWGPNPLRGAAIVDAAVDVLRAGPELELHYTVLAARIEDATGRRISGRDGPITLLANLHRDVRIVRLHGARSGIYGLA